VHFYNTRDVLPRCQSMTSVKVDMLAGAESTDNMNTSELGA